MQAMYCSSQVSIFHQPVYWDLFSPYLLGFWKCQLHTCTNTHTHMRTDGEHGRCCVSVPLSVSDVANTTRDKR